MLIRNAEIAGRRLDVRCENGRIRALGPGLAPRAGEACLEANGGALLPGLHDHHLHFFAFAAALESVPCGPPQVGSAEALARSLRAAPVRDGWIRGTGYFESVAGPLDRARLDALAPATPLRIQHRSGVMWFLNSAAIAVLGEGDTIDRVVERGRTYVRHGGALRLDVRAGAGDRGAFMGGVVETGAERAMIQVKLEDRETLGARFRIRVHRVVPQARPEDVTPAYLASPLPRGTYRAWVDVPPEGARFVVEVETTTQDQQVVARAWASPIGFERPWLTR